MKVDPNEHYGENYFYPNFKTWVDEYGNERKYYGPSKDWHGFYDIAGWIRDSIPQARTILDVGCSAGSFIAHASGFQFDCLGVDISFFAVRNCVERAKGKLRIADVTKSKPIGKFDIITGMDLMEHFYAKDLDRTLNYFRNSLKPGGHLFLCIATARAQNELWEHSSPEDEIPPNKNWLAVAGHVTIKYMEDWIKLFENHGFRADYERMMNFQLWRARHPELCNVDSWSVRNVLICNA